MSGPGLRLGLAVTLIKTQEITALSSVDHNEGVGYTQRTPGVGIFGGITDYEI